MRHDETIAVKTTGNNLQDYENTYKSFRWEEVEQQFTWAKTGKVNAGYEAIDRHVDEGKKTKSPCIIVMPSGTRNIPFTS